ncbi:MAG: hypothetical protein G01um10148_1064 [Parcubacteria group bacterium Gr01-1014_8]|nr:MAG: hypothetical protein G01um10148_1064 [Parcubacteria group bacterium Gr01-1014_8]
MSEFKDIQKTALTVTRFVGSPASIIIHTILFAGSFLAVWFDILNLDRMLLVLTTIVSLEAIYLAIFIQMTINYQAASIAEVREDVEEIQEDVGEIQEDVEEISEDVDELQEDIEEIGEDVEGIGEDVEEMTEEENAEAAEEERRKEQQKETLVSIESTLQKLIEEVEQLKRTEKPKDVKPMF